MMAAPQIPKAPPAPKAAQVDPTAPLPKVQAAPEPAPAPAPEPKAPVKLRIRTHYGYPIHIPHLNRLLRPDETVELDDHEWLRRQITAGTFIEV